MTEKASAIFEANCTKYSVQIECSTKISIALAASVSVTEPGTEIACEALKTKILTEYRKRIPWFSLLCQHGREPGIKGKTDRVR